MKKLFIITSVFVTLAFITASATIINVPADYDTIQVAINASSNGDTVLVAEGHYYERINFYGKGILLTSEFMWDGDTMHIQNTIIDADTLVLGVADTGSVVCFINGEDSASVIKGFTIQNGIGVIDGYNCRWGGGIDCYNSNPTINNNTITGNSAVWGGGICCWYNSSPTISNNTISENSAVWGGGILCEESSPTISNNTITGNSAVLGGGICCYYSNPTISNNTISVNSVSQNGGGICCVISFPIINNNTITGNSAYDNGGGISCDVSSPIINKNTIKENSANWDGGGISCNRSNPTISNNTISVNSAFIGGGIRCDNNSSPTISNNTISGNSGGWGGGIYFDVSSPIINNNTITGNSAYDNGGGIYCLYSNPVVINTILWANHANSDNEIYLDNESSISITYSDIQGSWVGEGNIDAVPLFRDPDNSDFHLMAIYCDDPYDSPCIDMGHPDSLDAYLDCQWGLGAERSDMGAYGGNAEPQTDIREYEPPRPKHYVLSQNYPNPFNPTTTISFTIEHPQFVTLKVYDLLGREVQTLVDEDRQAGLHNVAFDASCLSSGIYFYRLQAGDYSESKRMVLLK